MAVVETHKGAIDVECFLDGVIDELVALDVELPVGAVLAQVRRAGEPSRPSVPPVPAAAPPTSPARPSESVRPELPVSVEGPRRPVRPELVEGPAPREGKRPMVSPAARRARGNWASTPRALHGTGVDGAVTLADVELAAQAGTDAAPRRQRQPRRGFDPAQMRQAIAAAMGRSKREIPHYYLGTTVDFARRRRPGSRPTTRPPRRPSGCCRPRCC